MSSAPDGNSNVTGTTSVQTRTISAESLGGLMLYDVMNQLVQNCAQGADGSLSSDLADPNTLFTLTGRDSRGNKTNLIDPKQNTTVWKFDGASRKLENDQHLRADGEGTNAIVSTVTTKQAYDANSRFVKLTDSNGGTTNWAYDLLDRETLMKFHDGSTRLSVYDAASDVIGYTDENQSVRANTFDPLGRKVAVTLTLAAGVVGTTAQSFQFDGLGRMTFARDSIGSTNVDVGFVFDSIGRKIEEWQTLGADTRYVTHGQWTSLTPTDLTYPNARQITSGFDPLYRRNAVNEASGGASIAKWQFFGPRVATVALGNGIKTSFMNNAQSRSAVQLAQSTPGWGDITTDHLGYDGAGRPIAKRHFDGGDVLVGNTSAYDHSRNKLFERALHAESRSNLYPDYDSMNRLLEYQRGVLASGGGSVTTPISLPGTNQEQDYNLDALGNWSTTTITPEGGTPAVQTRIHNKLNEVNKYGSTYVSYDHGNNIAPHATRGNGNIADDGVRLYVYDAFNRLIVVKRKSDRAIIAQYTYDALGRRVLKIVTNGGLSGTIGNNTYRYISDSQQIVEELNGSNSTTRQFIWGQYIDELIQVKTYFSTGSQPLAAGDYYLLSDLLYRSQALTDSSGSIVEAYDCDSYGNTIIYSGPGTDNIWFTDDDITSNQPACETIFTGREYDPELKLYYYRTRYYLPSFGRFLGRDGAGYKDGLNLYQAVIGNPLVLLDPSGRSFDDILTELETFLGIASPAVQAEYDKVVWDKVNGTLDGLTDDGADLASLYGLFGYSVPRDSTGKALTFNFTDRAAAKCFEECWKKEMVDSVLMGQLSKVEGLGGALSLLPVSPTEIVRQIGDRAIDNGRNATPLNSIFSITPIQAGGVPVDLTGRGFKYLAKNLKSQLKGSRCTVRSLWKDAYKSAGGGQARDHILHDLGFEGWKASREISLSRMEKVASAAELLGNALQVADAMNEYRKCYNECNLPCEKKSVLCGGE